MLKSPMPDTTFAFCHGKQLQLLLLLSKPTTCINRSQNVALWGCPGLPPLLPFLYLRRRPASTGQSQQHGPTFCGVCL